MVDKTPAEIEAQQTAIDETLSYHINAILRECKGLVDIAVALNWDTPERRESNPTSAVYTLRRTQAITPDQVVDLSVPILSLLNQCYTHASLGLATAYKQIMEDRLAVEKVKQGGNTEDVGRSESTEGQASGSSE